MAPDVDAPPHPRPDASMSLLADIAAQALDPGYAVAAARREAAPASSGSSRPSPVLVAGVLLATLLVVVAAVQAHVRAPAAAKTKDDLVASVRRQSDAVAALARQVDQLRQGTAQLRDRTLAGSAAGARLATQVESQEAAAGQVAVSGPGLRVTLDDSKERNAGNRLQDRDLQSVVNALWAAGAEAIAVNGQRLTGQSAIREAGEAILVDFQPLSAPYVIEAIGNAQQLQPSYADSAAAARIQQFQQNAAIRVSVARENLLRLAAASDESLHYAHPIPSATAGSHP